jgi:cell division protein FtsB
MLDFRERSKMRRIVYAKPTILVLALLTLITARSAFGMYQKSKEAIAKRDKATAELQALKSRQEELDQDIARLGSERGQEEEIRDRFMVAKEGENVIIVADPEGTKTRHTVTVNEDENDSSFFNKMRNAVVGLSEE